jgi:hypothetical protein
MKEFFKEVRFKPESLEKIEQCNEIIEDYQSQGLRLTLRQLYYQLVSKNIIPNVERSYKNLTGLVTDARLAGLMDWDAIEDRVRQPNIPTDFKNLKELVDAALNSYRLPRWEGQKHYVELWVEKDALAGVLRPIARQYHVTMMVNRGYSSASAMYESAKRYYENARRSCVLLYLGDHDPSGEDMVRDVRDRLHLFGAELHVQKLALTIKQVKRFNPPPNPAKITDPRAAAYTKLHGQHSWEVDALPPNILAQIIRGVLDSLVDRTLMDAIISCEKEDKKLLVKAVRSLMKEKKNGPDSESE